MENLLAFSGLAPVKVALARSTTLITCRPSPTLGSVSPHHQRCIQSGGSFSFFVSTKAFRYNNMAWNTAQFFAWAPTSTSPKSPLVNTLQMAVSPFERVRVQLEKLFVSKDIERVLSCWDFSAQGSVYEVHHSDGRGHQKATSYVPGLTAMPFHDKAAEEYPWVKALQENAHIVQKELQDFMNGKGIVAKYIKEAGKNKGKGKVLEGLENVQSLWQTAVRDDAIAYGPHWRTLVLKDHQWHPINVKLFPKTTQLLKTAKVPAVEVFFAKQAPHTGIKPHTDFTNFILTSHLALQVPEGDCWIKVGETKKNWKEKKVLVMDTSFIHETFNNTDDERYVLLIRHWHPELTPTEITALQFIFSVIDEPEILDELEKAEAKH